MTEDNSTGWFSAVGSTQWVVCPTGESLLVLPIVLMGGGVAIIVINKLNSQVHVLLRQLYINKIDDTDQMINKIR